MTREKPREYACAHCGNTFIRKASLMKRGLKPYCSKACSAMAQRKQVDVTCRECGKSFSVRAYRAETAKYCSRSCQGTAAIKERGLRGPDLTGNELRKGLRPTNAFTSEQAKAMNRKPPVVETCAFCGASVARVPHRANRGAKNFCSVKCRTSYMQVHQSGENSPMWVGGIHTSRGRNWKQVRKLVIEAQGGCCACCGKVVGRSMPVHHITPYREFRTWQEANAVENLIGLCQPCHMKWEYRETSEE